MSNYSLNYTVNVFEMQVNVVDVTAIPYDFCALHYLFFTFCAW